MTSLIGDEPVDDKALACLRRMLDCLIGQSELLPAQHEGGIERLRVMFGHSIEVLPTEYQDSYTCFAFALGLSTLEDYMQQVRIKFANSAFVRKVIKDGSLLCIAQAQPDCIIMYSNEGCLRHAGVITESTNMVMSKWGGNKLHRHPIFEVPASYGSDVSYYMRPDAELAFQWYSEWSAQHD